MQKKSPFTLGITNIIPLFVWSLIIFITWTFMHGAEHLLEMTPEAMGKYFDYKWIIIIHITAGGGSLVLGIIQFWEKLRQYSWKLHRIIGFLYLSAVFTSSVCAAILAFSTSYKVNVSYAFSLQVWISVWVSATALAYYFALIKNFTLHRQWMVRSYIVTIAFVISGLILKVPYVQQLGSFAEISPSLFWLGWSVPLYIYQVVLSVTNRQII